MMPELTPILSTAELRRLVFDLARQIEADYQGRDLVLIGVLKGSFVFLSDLIRELQLPVRVDFVQASSYGNGTESSGQIRLSKGIGLDIRRQDVLVVEDIVDTGLTVRWIIDYLESLQPRSVAVCALINKPGRREVDVPIAYAGYVAGDGFLVGYGLDYAEQYRQLPEICLLNPRGERQR
jgi:hypoxanthine phosphoribosyltransferase